MATLCNGYATRTGRAILRAAVVFACAGLAASCQSKDDKLDLQAYVDTIEPADVLYNQGLANMNAGRLREAAKKFEAVDRQHPYSEYARKANVMAAFTSYKLGNFDEAIQAARRFVNLYPTDQDAAYAQYIIGLSYFAQMPEVTRDQRDTKLAIQNFNELLERYPGSIYEEDAKAKIRAARDQLAGKEMQIGRYYLERREYPGAINRFRNVVEEYSNTRHVEEALARLVETYFAMGLVSEAQTAAAILGHNFPDSQWYADSYALLQSGGVEPREHKGSWLSRIGGKIIGTGS
ncbi:MAG: outer membrane protein assembly factor BamD [Oricola sp.]